MFLPTTKKEMEILGWESLDIILISGDSYIDSYYNGSAVIGQYLTKHGFRVGIIAQPNINNETDIKRLGAPNLYWGVSGGCVDSMVANYTATKKRRSKDDFTPGGINDRRPDRAVIAYTNLIKRHFKSDKKTIIIGGIESSLRRLVHYDFWTNKLRKSILFNSKADILSYGMGEKSMLELAHAFQNGDDYKNIKGICYISNSHKNGYITLPSFTQCQDDKYEFIKSFKQFYENNHPLNSTGLSQKQDTRYIIQNPPSDLLTTEEMNEIYGLDYMRELHPYYKKIGDVKALETIKNSVTTHRGCYGECNFCAITVHQGRSIINRSSNSILNEVANISKLESFKGYISDLGGATANMYGTYCKIKQKFGSCKDKRCMYPKICENLNMNHKIQLDLLKKANKIEGIKKIFIASGIRYDLIIDDKNFGNCYLENLVEHHVSGQLKIAPEHSENEILKLMGKPDKKVLIDFRDKFYKLNTQLNKKQFLTYYLIAAHPGCTFSHMKDMKRFVNHELKLTPEQVQIFTPSPSTYSTLMYYTELNPFNGKNIIVEKDILKKQRQKDILTEKTQNYKQVKNKNTKNKKSGRTKI